MIRQILAKDWRLLWPMALFVALIQLCMVWVEYTSGFFGAVPAVAHMLRPLTIAWYAGIALLAVAVVQQDAMAAVDQDWLIRPVKRSQLLLAKLLFVVLTVSVPMFVLDLARAVAGGFPLTASLAVVTYKELYVIVCLIVPVIALASTAARMSELVAFGAALVATYAVSVGVAAAAFGANSCPTCDSGVGWLQHLFGHLGVFVGAIAIIALQYFRRATNAARALLILGVVALVFVQLQWSAAWGIQCWLSPASNEAQGVSIALNSSPLVDPAINSAATPSVGGAARTLMHGDVGVAGRYVQGRAQRGAVQRRIELPLQISGMLAGELLYIDRAEVSWIDEQGRRLYRGTDSDVLAVDGSSSVAPSASAQLSNETIAVPAATYSAIASRASSLQLQYFLTLMTAEGRYRLNVQESEMRSAGLGHCAMQLSQDATSISLVCHTLGLAPTCLSATLYGVSQHNPEILRCDPDYRPYLPAMTDVLSGYALEIPIRDRSGLVHYPVPPSELAQSYVLLKVYQARGHFTRSAVASGLRLTNQG